jgi:hypothetical protein
MPSSDTGSFDFTHFSSTCAPSLKHLLYKSSCDRIIVEIAPRSTIYSASLHNISLAFVSSIRPLYNYRFTSFFPLPRIKISAELSKRVHLSTQPSRRIHAKNANPYLIHLFMIFRMPFNQKLLTLRRQFHASQTPCGC